MLSRRQFLRASGAAGTAAVAATFRDDSESRVMAAAAAGVRQAGSPGGGPPRASPASLAEAGLTLPPSSSESERIAQIEHHLLNARTREVVQLDECGVRTGAELDPLDVVHVDGRTVVASQKRAPGVGVDREAIVGGGEKKRIEASSAFDDVVAGRTVPFDNIIAGAHDPIAPRL